VRVASPLLVSLETSAASPFSSFLLLLLNASLSDACPSRSCILLMFYQVISTRFFSGVAVPPYTWAGVALVFGGSLTYLLSPKLPPADEPKAKAA